jgi:hypothetical protein
MDETFKSYKRRFNNALQPIKVMLVHQQAAMTKSEWLMLVERTRNSVIEKPREYLSVDAPDQELLEQIVDQIFADFILHAPAPRS